MAGPKQTAPSIFIAATEAVAALFEDGFYQVRNAGVTDAISAHSEIEQAAVASKSVRFYQRFVPLRNEMVSLLSKAYRGFFKVAIANQHQTGDNPDLWAQIQLQPALRACLAWIPDWYMLACDGQNQGVRRIGSAPFVPGGTVSFNIQLAAPPPISAPWQAPSWLFELSAPLFGVGLMKQQHIPARDSDEKLGASHTRLLLKGARKVFLWQLGDEINRARNEEFAAAGAIRTETVHRGADLHEQKPSKGRFTGFAGLGQKNNDLSRYIHKLTDKQQMAFSLKYEYELGLAEIASRMGVDRKTAYEHIEAANRKIRQVQSNENRKARRSNVPED